jgi:hypothetical protein
MRRVERMASLMNIGILSLLARFFFPGPRKVPALSACPYRFSDPDPLFFQGDKDASPTRNRFLAEILRLAWRKVWNSLLNAGLLLQPNAPSGRPLGRSRNGSRPTAHGKRMNGFSPYAVHPAPCAGSCDLLMGWQSAISLQLEKNFFSKTLSIHHSD